MCIKASNRGNVLHLPGRQHAQILGFSPSQHDADAFRVLRYAVVFFFLSLHMKIIHKIKVFFMEKAMLSY